MTDRILGVLFFLPVPIVLVLFTRAPLGVVPSLALGTVLMITHRLYARPFALRRARQRCLWCGGTVGDAGVPITVREPMGETTWHACRHKHGERLTRTLAWASRHTTWLRVGIGGGTVLFLVTAVLSATGHSGPLTFADAVAGFKLAVAAIVLPLGWLASWRGRPADEPPRMPFPVHIQALIGTWAVLWLFRLVGLVWLAQGLLHFSHRS